MVLHVEFSRLAEEAKRHGLKPWAYLVQAGSKVTVTIADPGARTILQSETKGTLDRAFQDVKELGLEPSEGRWSPDPLSGEIHLQEQIWVAAIAYKSSEEKPGLWVHAYRGTPSAGDVMRDFYEEMATETDLAGISLDEFVSAVSPNIVVLGPNELAAFADAASERA